MTMMKKFLSIHHIFVFSFLLILLFFTIMKSPLFSFSHAQTAIDESSIQYLSVPIVAEDTLSGIASEYYSDEFGSMDQYISKIKEYNSLTSDAIYAGNHLIIPIYAASDDVS